MGGVRQGSWLLDQPSAHVKSNRAHKLPLNPAAVELIERLRKRRKATTAWVFPGQRAGEPLKQLRSVWHWVRDRAALGPNARLLRPATHVRQRGGRRGP